MEMVLYQDQQNGAIFALKCNNFRFSKLNGSRKSATCSILYFADSSKQHPQYHRCVNVHRNPSLNDPIFKKPLRGVTYVRSLCVLHAFLSYFIFSLKQKNCTNVYIGMTRCPTTMRENMFKLLKKGHLYRLVAFFVRWYKNCRAYQFPQARAESPLKASEGKK